MNHHVIAAIKQTLQSEIKELQVIGKERTWTVRPLYETKSKVNFASVLYVAESTDSKNKKISLMVKVLPDEPAMRVLQNSDKQFYNEGHMLLNVIPLLIQYSGLEDASPVSSMFPKCYYANEDLDNAMIVMENLQVDGYELAELSLDYEHCTMALEGLARFHALGYAMKLKHNDIFSKKVVNTLKEARYCNQNRNRQIVYQRYTAMQPVNVILESEEPEMIEFRKINAKYLEKLDEVFKNTYDLQLQLMEPKEPLAVLCHGDFNRNNLLFTHVENKPVHMKMLDFQTVRYANPATDIVLLLHLNMTSKVRRANIDMLLETYQKTLIASLVAMTGLNKEELELAYSLDAIKVDYERHALLGYVVSSMFIHFMLATVEELQEMDVAKRLSEDEEIPSEEFLKKSVMMGGDEALQRSIAIIQEMAAMKNLFTY